MVAGHPESQRAARRPEEALASGVIAPGRRRCRDVGYGKLKEAREGQGQGKRGIVPLYTQTNTPENAVVVFARKAHRTIGSGCRFLAPSLARDRGELPRGGPAGLAHAQRNPV